MINRQYLIRRSKTYYFRIRVPKSLCVTLDRTVLWRSLSTDQLIEAQRRSRHVLALTRALWSEVHLNVTPAEAEGLLRRWLTAPIGQGSEEGLTKGLDALTLPEIVVDGRSNSIQIGVQQSASEVSIDLVSRPSSPEHRTRFSEAAEEALKELCRTEGMCNLRRTEYTWAIRTFMEWLEDDPFADEITPTIAGRYKVDLTYYPSAGSKRPEYKSLGFKERVQAARATGERRLLRLATINSNYLMPLRRLYEWRRSSGYLPYVNPFANISAGRSRRVRIEAQRRCFSDDEVCTMLSLPLFTGARASRHSRLYMPGPIRVSDWRYWVPLIGLFSGLRLGEACALAVADIGEQDGVAYIYVRNLLEGQNIKTRAAWRKVPIHCELLAAGLLEYVAQVQQAGYERLFPDLKICGNGYMSGVPRKFFEHIIDRARDANNDEPGRLVFHSIRHTVVGKLRSLNCRADISSRIIGHEGGGSHAAYGAVDLKVLRSWVNQIAYTGLDLKRVRQPYSTWGLPAGNHPSPSLTSSAERSKRMA